MVSFPYWVVSLRDVPLKVWLSVAGAVVLPVGAVIAALASFAIGSIDQRLSSMEGQLSRQDTIVNARLEAIADRIEDATQFEFDASDDMTEIRERLSSIEAQVTLSNEILFRADSPAIEREFLPVLTRVPVDFYGGGGAEAEPAEGFEDMVYSLPFPQNISDRDEAIEFITETHLDLLESQARGYSSYPSCGFDVLTHAVEAFVSVGASAYSDAIALEAIRKVAANVRKVVEDGTDIEARSQMLLGSAMAAQAFNVSGLGTVHGTGHAISARLNAAHGQTLATMMPHVMEYNMPEREEKYVEVARILNPSDPATGAGAIDAVLRLRSDIGIDRSISDLGGNDDLLAVLIEDAVADPVNFTNPRPVDAEAIEKLYRAAW